MSISHFHRDVKEKSYLSGVWTAIRNRSALARGFAGYFHNDTLHYGWCDFDPHTIDIAVDGKPIARIESHHNREDIHVYNDHPKADKFIVEALRRGYEPVEKKS